MVKSDRTVISSTEEIEKIFGHDETRKTIADKFITPMPEDGGKTIVILHSKGDDGTLGLLHKVKNEGFETGEAVFMMVAEYDHPEVELQMGVNKSLFNSLDRLCNSEGWKLPELPGKIVHMTANWYPKVKCSGVDKRTGCTGKNCPKCLGTGNSKVFNVRARHDLMSPTGQTKKKVADEF